MTKVAFVVHRANYLKHYGPIIDAALQRGWKVECWLEDAPLGEKEYLRITPNMITALWGDQAVVRTFALSSEIAELNQQVKPTAIISLGARRKYFEQPGNERFITLQHSVDLFVANTIQDLASSDYVCLYTPFWLDYAVNYYKLLNGADGDEVQTVLAGKVVCTGFAQMDAFGIIDTVAVRQRWGIPQDKKVVLALPLDVTGWPGAWAHFFQRQGFSQWSALWKARKEPGFIGKYWRWALHEYNDEQLAGSIQRFAENNNAVLVLKGREKDLLRPSWTNKAFQVHYDDSHYPATVFEAIAIADVCILFYSTATQEAVYAGVPVVCIDRPNKNTPKHNLWRQAHVGGPYNFPGAVEWMTLPQAIERLPDAKLEEFKMGEEARRQYLALYNGPADHHASQRILDLVTA